jgi:hypothetical protein
VLPKTLGLFPVMCFGWFWLWMTIWIAYPINLIALRLESWVKFITSFGKRYCDETA